MKKRLGGWILTYTGRKFYPLDPSVDDFSLLDIAHALSQVNRSNGHTKAPYSVAQHSVLVATVLKQLGYNTRTQFIGLNHDVSEAYLSDVPSPVKEWLPDYLKIEAKIQEVAYHWAGLGEVTSEDYEPVYKVDKDIFAVEADNLLPFSNFDVPMYLKDMVIIPWPPEIAEREFIKLWRELEYKQ